MVYVVSFFQLEWHFVAVSFSQRSMISYSKHLVAYTLFSVLRVHAYWILCFRTHVYCSFVLETVILQTEMAERLNTIRRSHRISFEGFV